LLDYRIPHVGFDRRSVFFLWREFTYFGTTGMFRHYGPQAMNSSVRLKSFSVLGLLALLYLGFVVFMTGLIPWASYQYTLLESRNFEYVIKPSLVIPLCWIPVAIACFLDFAGVKFISAIGGMWGTTLGFLIVLETAMLNENPAMRAARKDSVSGKVVLGVVIVCVGLFVLYQVIVTVARLVIYSWQAFRFWLFKRSLKKGISSVEGQLSSNQLLQFYETFKSDQGKEMVIQLLEKHAEYDETLVNRLMDFAYREKNKFLADGLWHLIYELEKRQLRVA